MSEPVVRSARGDEFDTLMTRLWRAFGEANVSHPPFSKLYPAILQPTPECLDNFLVAEIEGELLAGVQVVPQLLHLPWGTRLSTAGVGQVFCLPEFRGKGLMTRLLQAATARMDRMGVVLSVLSGDRLRYNRFGWEIAGLHREVTLSAALLRGAEQPREDHGISQWTGGAYEADRMRRAYEALPYRVERGDLHRAFLGAARFVTWVCQRGDAFAYITLDGNRAVEQAGDQPALVPLLRFLVERLHSLRLVLPDETFGWPANSMVDALGARWSTYTTGNIRVHSLHHIVDAYLPLLRQRLAGWTGELEIPAPAGQSAVRLIANGTDIEICDSVAPAVELCQCSRYLFGPHTPLAIGERLALPLPFSWMPLDHV